MKFNIQCLNNQSDDERKEWEDYHLEKFIDENGSLPPHNRNRENNTKVFMGPKPP